MSNKFAKNQEVTKQGSNQRVTVQKQEFYSGSCRYICYKTI